MKGNDLGLMLDYLDGNLGAEEALDLRARLDTDLRLADELFRIARDWRCSTRREPPSAGMASPPGSPTG
jgi:anti-sigma factor RsiW